MECLSITRKTLGLPLAPGEEKRKEQKGKGLGKGKKREGGSKISGLYS